MKSIFILSNFLVLPVWFCMIVLPHWSFTRRMMRTYWPVVLPAVLFVLLFVPQIFVVVPTLITQPTLEGMQQLVSTDIGATTAWVHLITFDLFIGRWAYLESREQQMNVWLMAPILFIILLVGPLGLLIYLISRNRSA